MSTRERDSASSSGGTKAGHIIENSVILFLSSLDWMREFGALHPLQLRQPWPVVAHRDVIVSLDVVLKLAAKCGAIYLQGQSLALHA